MKYCIKCGAELADTAEFCPSCGTRVDQANCVPEKTQNQSVYKNPHRVNRSLLKHILLGIITFTIYDWVVMSNISEEINVVATKHDSDHTMHYLIATLLLGPITLGIVPLVWRHKICNRMGNELKIRKIPYVFDASTFWLWGVLGALIIVGPFVYGHKFFKAMNLINADYNIHD